MSSRQVGWHAGVQLGTAVDCADAGEAAAQQAGTLLHGREAKMLGVIA